MEPTDEGVNLVVIDSWSDRADRALRSGVADGLVCNYTSGFREADLEFVRDWPVKRLSVVARNIEALGPVHRLSATLESLSLITAPSAVVDVAALPNLTELSAEWEQVRDTIAAAPQLLAVYLGTYTEFDLTPLVGNPALTKLVMKDRPRVRTLDGVERLARLTHLGVYLATNLEDIDHLAIGDGSQLRTLQLASCRHIARLDPVGRCSRLEFLNVSNCGDIESFAPLDSLDELRKLHAYETTRVVDGDLTPILTRPNLQELRMMSRRHYRPNIKEIQAVIEERIA